MEYTARAIAAIPEKKSPWILDIGFEDTFDEFDRLFGISGLYSGDAVGGKI